MRYENSATPFPAALQNWRAEMGLTRREAARTLGVRATTFEGWLAGRRCGQEAVIRKLMDCIVKLRHTGAG